MTNDDLSREDRLIHRAIDGTAGVGDWAELELLARRDAMVWKRLAISMRGELTLRRAGPALEDRLSDLRIDRVGAGRRAPLIAGSLGWAAALLIGFLWWGTPYLGLGGGATDPTLSSLGADAAWARYLRAGESEGRLVRELPPVMLEANPSVDGTAVEVWFVRRTIERATVDEIHEVTEDDAGQLTTRPVPVTQLVRNDPI